MNRRRFLRASLTGTAGLSLLGSRLASLSATPTAASALAEPGARRPFELAFRQIHLDFHTSERIAGVGDRFDPEEFAATLAGAHVNSVTCFGRCHHGWIYHDTSAFPERRHPHLQRNLLKEQIEACHRRGIRVPAYITVQWDFYTAQRHPEWLQREANGTPVGTPPYEAGFYQRLCLNSPYVAFLRSYLTELLDTLPIDGVFLDIVKLQDCSCLHCQEAMLTEGLDPARVEVRRRFGAEVTRRFLRETTALIRQRRDDISIFYNSGHVGPQHRAIVGDFTHLELESLPSGGWGYLHFPLAVRYARNLRLDCLGMTGKFHTSWGDFHSFKNPAALQFECFNMLALNAKCSIGDQLHPNGRLDPYTYQLVGSVYAEVERKEPWCQDAQPVTEIGVLTPEEFAAEEVRKHPAAVGAVRMLQENRHQFDMLDSQSDFSRYRLLVLPDTIPVGTDLRRKLSQFLERGGALIASYESGLDPTGADFGLRELGVRKTGDGPLDAQGRPIRGRVFERNDYAQYLRPTGAIGHGLNPTEHVMYIRGLDVETTSGARALARVIQPYFDRTYQHFSSHRQSPSSGQEGAPAIVRNGRTIYFAHPIFSQYNRNAPIWCRTLFANALDQLLPDPLVRLGHAPSSTLATLNEQPQHRRYVLHLLNYVPERRSEDFDTIEDVVPLYGLEISLALPRSVKEARTAPDNQPLQHALVDGRTRLMLPRLDGHQLIALPWA